MKLNVAFITRSSIDSVPGGDTVQISNTMNALRSLGISCELKRANERIDYKKYQLLHFFNITRPADIISHISHSQLPYLVSPIYVDYSEYDKYHRKGIAGRIFRHLDKNSIEYLKNLARFTNGSDKQLDLDYVLKGHKRSVKKILENAALVLPNSVSEARRLKENYQVNFPFQVIPNGVDLSMFEHTSIIPRDPRLVICVARIEGIKNQFNLIRALNHSDYSLKLIGDPAPNQSGYYRLCREIAGPNVEFISAMPQKQLLPHYAMASIHVLPSWFETTGLSSLEAVIMGCKPVVSSRGDVYDYLGDDVFYCDPSSAESIRQAIENASRKETSESLKNRIRSNFHWDMAALRTREAYQNVIDNLCN